MRRFLGWPLTLCFAGAFLGPVLARAQARGQWHVADGDAAHDNWQKIETKISAETVPGSFKLLWKMKLGRGSTHSESFSEPLFIPEVIGSRGFKDTVLWGDASTLYAVDYGLGTLLWKKDFKVESPRSRGGCGGSNMQMVMEPPLVIHFGVHAPAAQHAPPPPPPLPPAAERWIGEPPRAGGFALKAIYVLTSDGYLHEQILATGLDYAPAVKFLPAPSRESFGLNINKKAIYTESREGCHGLSNAAWSIDLNAPEHAIASYPSQKVSLADLTGPAIGSDGTVYILAGSGTSDLPSGVYADSVVALTAKDLKVKDWYTPSNSGKGNTLKLSPVVLSDQGKELVAAPGSNDSIALLNGASLGGADHHTPWAQSGRISRVPRKDAWDGVASWQDKRGGVWVLASIMGPIERDLKFSNSNGPAPHGSIVAFKIEEKDGQPALTPEWISRDLRNPAPPVIANGVVFALAGGSASEHAILYALDAGTGKELYSSGDAIGSYAHLSGVSVGDGHLFFTTHDNTLYSFGIPIEH